MLAFQASNFSHLKGSKILYFDLLPLDIFKIIGYSLCYKELNDQTLFGRLLTDDHFAKFIFARDFGDPEYEKYINSLSVEMKKWPKVEYDPILNNKSHYFYYYERVSALYQNNESYAFSIASDYGWNHIVNVKIWRYNILAKTFDVDFLEKQQNINILINSKGDNPLIYAIRNKSYHTAKILLEKGINIFHQNNDNENALWCAIENSPHNLSFDFAAYFNLVKMLINADTTPNKESLQIKSVNSPYQLINKAIESFADKKILDFIIKNDPNFEENILGKNSDNITPFYIIAKSCLTLIDVLKILVNNLEARSPQIINSPGTDPQIIKGVGRDNWSKRKIIGEAISIKNKKDSNNALMLAIMENRYPELIDFFLAYDKENDYQALYSQRLDGKTTLMLAVNKKEIISRLLQADQKGKLLTMCDKDENGPLNYFSNSYDSLKLLQNHLNKLLAI